MKILSKDIKLKFKEGRQFLPVLFFGSLKHFAGTGKMLETTERGKNDESKESS